MIDWSTSVVAGVGGRERRRRLGSGGWQAPRVARYAWPAGVGTAGLALVRAPTRCATAARAGAATTCTARRARTSAGDGFLRAAEALTGAPISWGNEVELLINGDRIFPASWRRSAAPRGRSA